jgi:hypothetical protein
VTGRVALAADDASPQLTTSPAHSWQPPKRLGKKAGKHRRAAQIPSRTTYAPISPAHGGGEGLMTEAGQHQDPLPDPRPRRAAACAGTLPRPQITTGTYVRKPHDR